MAAVTGARAVIAVGAALAAAEVAATFSDVVDTGAGRVAVAVPVAAVTWVLLVVVESVRSRRAATASIGAGNGDGLVVELRECDPGRSRAPVGEAIAVTQVQLPWRSPGRWAPGQLVTVRRLDDSVCFARVVPRPHRFAQLWVRPMTAEVLDATTVPAPGGVRIPARAVEVVTVSPQQRQEATKRLLQQANVRVYSTRRSSSGR